MSGTTEVNAVLAALADPTRRAILESVRRGRRSVVDIAGDFSVSRPAVSQHLRVLEEAGLLRSQREGRQNFYGLDLRGLGALRAYVEGFWDDVLGAFQAAALAEAGSPGADGPRETETAHESRPRESGTPWAGSGQQRPGSGQRRGPSSRPGRPKRGRKEKVR